MSIKVTVEDNATPKEKPFPKVMVSQKGYVVLFHKEGCGIVLESAGGVYKTGDYSTTWSMSYFEDFTGTITMECN